MYRYRYIIYIYIFLIFLMSFALKEIQPVDYVFQALINYLLGFANLLEENLLFYHQLMRKLWRDQLVEHQRKRRRRKRNQQKTKEKKVSTLAIQKDILSYRNYSSVFHEGQKNIYLSDNDIIVLVFPTFDSFFFYLFR